MKNLFLLILISATSLSFLIAQDVLNIYYETVPGSLGTDTVKVYIRSSTPNPINIRSVNFSFAYKGSCAAWQGLTSMESTLINQWGTYLQGIDNTNPLPVPRTYDGQVYSSRFSYGNASIQLANMVSAPANTAPMLEVFATVFQGSCSNRIYMEHVNEHPVNQVGNHENQPMPYTITRFGSGLPVEYAYFTAEKTSPKHVLLEWATEKEINNDYFAIEKSFDADFSSSISLAIITGRGTATGVETYSFDDYSPMAAFVYYRLRQVDMDGSFSFSNTQKLSFEGVDLVNMLAYPNPTTDFVNLTVFDPEENMYEYRLLDMTGRQLIYEVRMLGGSFGSSFQLDLSSFVKGIYSLEMINLDRRGDSKTLLIVKK